MKCLKNKGGKNIVNGRMIKTGIYRHFKGAHYRLLRTVEHSETGEDLVLYRCLEGNNVGKVYVRPVEMFFSEVDKEKYPDVEQRYRFEWIEWGTDSTI